MNQNLSIFLGLVQQSIDASHINMQEIEGRDIFADDFIRQEQLERESESPSEIQKFFEGTTILVTGGTGFFGQILVDKLLRVCSRINRVYLLMRPKKGKSVQERLEEQFQGPVFDPLKTAFPDFRHKVSIIEGDLANEKDIISEEDRQTLVDTVNVVFHCAATVRFDEKLRRAVNINIRSTKLLLDMAHEMKNLKAFVHVSTAYSNCPERDIKEQFYSSPFDYKKIMGILDVLDDKILDRLTPELLGPYPNTYAFTKMIAESVVKDYGKGLPIAVIRPSIVISTYIEPISGWINNYYGPQGVVFGAGLGLLRTLHCDPNVIANMVPVDLVINALVALAWDLGQTKGDNPNFEKIMWKENLDANANVGKMETTEDIPIMNYVSSGRNRITWGEFLKKNYKAGENNYSPIQIWHSSLTLNSNYYVDRFYRIFCHLMPALVVDLIAISINKEPILWKSYKKIHKFSGVISYFCTSEWNFEEENVIKLWSKLSPKDKKLFHFNIQDISWEHYFESYLKGIRVYLVKDALSSLPQGKRRAQRLKIYHYTLVAVLYSILLYTLYKMYSYLFI